MVSSGFVVRAQEDEPDSDVHNSIKLNLLGGIYKNISFYYEHSLNNRTSLSLGASFMLPRKNIGNLRFDKVIQHYKYSKFMGFTATPEIKFYADQTAMKGLYLSVYLRVVNLSGDLDFDVVDSGGIKPVWYKLTAQGHFSEYGGGLQLGYQWLIKQRLAIDFFFIGPKVSRYQLTYEAQERSDNTTDIDWDSIYEDMDHSSQMPFGTSAKITQGTNSIKIRWPFITPNIRVGLSVGFCF